MHSKFSIDGKMTMKEACDVSVKKGLTGIAFTEHLDYDFPDVNNTQIIDFDEYIREIDEIALIYKNKLKVLKSIEVGYQPHVIEKNNDIIENRRFDFVLSSVHIVNFMDPYSESFYDGITIKEACLLYLNEILSSIENYPHFDILGHIDYIRRFLPIENKFLKYIDYKDILDEIIKILITNDKGLEFNTGGLRYNIYPPFTDINIYKRYKELGGDKICLGSDAHTTINIADGFSEATDLLKGIGFKYFVHFEERKAIYEKI